MRYSENSGVDFKSYNQSKTSGRIFQTSSVKDFSRILEPKSEEKFKLCQPNAHATSIKM